MKNQDINKLSQRLSGLFVKHLSRKNLTEIEILGIKTGTFYIFEKKQDLEMTLYEVIEFLKKNNEITNEIIKDLRHTYNY